MVQFEEEQPSEQPGTEGDEPEGGSEEGGA
jgi:hypothetical protein